MAEYNCGRLSAFAVAVRLYKRFGRASAVRELLGIVPSGSSRLTPHVALGCDHHDVCLP